MKLKILTATFMVLSVIACKKESNSTSNNTSNSTTPKTTGHLYVSVKFPSSVSCQYEYPCPPNTEASLFPPCLRDTVLNLKNISINLYANDRKGAKINSKSGVNNNTSDFGEIIPGNYYVEAISDYGADALGYSRNCYSATKIKSFQILAGQDLTIEPTW